jgi:hypothetical protein
MRKKMMDQKTEPSIVAIASGYTMNTRPGPATNSLLMNCQGTESEGSIRETACNSCVYRPTEVT